MCFLPHMQSSDFSLYTCPLMQKVTVRGQPVQKIEWERTKPIVSGLPSVLTRSVNNQYRTIYKRSKNFDKRPNRSQKKFTGEENRTARKWHGECNAIVYRGRTRSMACCDDNDECMTRSASSLLRHDDDSLQFTAPLSRTCLSAYQ